MNSCPPPAAGLRNLTAVVIGTSAGGVDALGLLLPGLDRRCRAAILIVIHLPRDRPSLIRDLYTARCPLLIHEAQDKQPVEPGNVYFAPPDYHLMVDSDERGAWMALSVDEPQHFSRPSIDVLFESAAECWGSRLLGVILTGASHDGARGLAAIARAGGVTVVQAPAGATAQTMPEAAIGAGAAQHVLSLEAIRDLLGQVGHAA